MLYSIKFAAAAMAIAGFVTMRSGAGAASDIGLTPQTLRCEYLDNPIGVDVARPRLSWHLTSPTRGARQTAYEVQVASTRQQLESGNADLWATGKVASTQQNGIEFGGTPLQSRQVAYWRVRTWNEADLAGPWSQAAWWEVGLRSPADWQAKWIDEGRVQSTAKLDLRYASYESTNRKTTKDVLPLLKTKLQDGRLDFVVNNDSLGGDPSRNNKKQLTVRYTLDGGPEMSEIFRENAQVWLPPLPPQNCGERSPSTSRSRALGSTPPRWVCTTCTSTASTRPTACLIRTGPTTATGCVTRPTTSRTCSGKVRTPSAAASPTAFTPATSPTAISNTTARGRRCWRNWK